MQQTTLTTESIKQYLAQELLDAIANSKIPPNQADRWEDGYNYGIIETLEKITRWLEINSVHTS